MLLVVYLVAIAMIVITVLVLPDVMDSRYVPDVPLWLAILGGGGVVILLFFLNVAIAVYFDPDNAALKSIVVNGMYAVTAGVTCLVGLVFANSVGAAVSRALYNPPLEPRSTRRYDTADQFVRDEKFDEAIAEYRLYFLEDPADPEPLLRAAALAVEQRRYDLAAEIYGEVAERFPERASVWAPADLTRANILANEMGAVEASNVILRDLAERAPELDEGRAAVKILDRRSR